MKPKVAVIIERADVALGGAERSVFEMTQALAAIDLDVHILAAKGQTDANNVHFLCSNVPGKRTSHDVFADALKKHLKENHYDIIHSILPFDFVDVYQPRDGSYIESAIKNAASYPNKFIESFKKATALLNRRRARLIRAEKQLAEKPNGPIVAAISNYVASQFRQRYGLNDNRLVVIFNGVKTSEPPDQAQVNQLRAKIFTQLNLKQSDNPALFLFAGHNFRRKGLACLIKALHVISTRPTDRPACLIVAGGDRTSGYSRLAHRLNVQKQVLFLGSVSKIADALAVADVAVLPTFYDPCSRFILEALAAGKPVITTRLNGAVDQFTDSRHGKIIDRPDDITGLADALAYFTIPANVQKVHQAIVDDNLKQLVSISRAAAQLKKLYDDIIQKRRRQ